jgi:LPXTG-motif cell wall-anchored protein
MADNPILLVIAGLGVLLLLLLVLMVTRRRRGAKKSASKPATPPKAVATAAPPAAESAPNASLTSLIGQAKVAAQDVSVQKSASLRQMSGMPDRGKSSKTTER